MNKLQKRLMAVTTALLGILLSVPAWSALTVQSRDMDMEAEYTQWRRLIIRVLNDGPAEVNMADLILEYVIDDDTVDGLNGEIWHYVVHSDDWAIQGGTNSEVHIDFQPKGDDSTIRLQFDDRMLPVNGTAEIQFGVFYSSWQFIDETTDPSYIPGNNFVDNTTIIVNGGEATNDAYLYSSIVQARLRTCGIRAADGKAECFGLQEAGENMVPVDGDYSELFATDNLTCGLDSSTGFAECWGTNFGGANGVPDGVSFSTLALRYRQSCGLRADDNTLVCWGADDKDDPAPVGVAFDSLAQSAAVICGIRSDNKLVQCWGDDSHNQMSPPLEQFSYISGGMSHFCGTAASDGTTLCWGRASEGQCDVPAGVPFRDLEMDLTYTCGLRSDTDTVECWGLLPFDEMVPGYELLEGVEFDSITAADITLCGLRKDDGHLFCIGGETFGQSTATVSSEFIAVSHKDLGVCGIRAADQRLHCWGQQRWEGGVPNPTDVAFDEISVSDRYNCGIRSSDSRVQCWMAEEYSEHAPPASIEEIEFDHVAAGMFHGCAIRSDNGMVECWGDNRWGISEPPSGLAFAGIYATYTTTCGLRADNGHAVCWGKVIDDDMSLDLTPPAGVAFTKLAVDLTHICGIRADNGEILCWGHNDNGQLDAPAGIEFFDVSTTVYDTTCGLKVSDGKPLCWGHDRYGILAAPDVELVDIDGGENSYCGVRADDGTEICWGLISRGLYAE